MKIGDLEWWPIETKGTNEVRKWESVAGIIECSSEFRYDEPVNAKNSKGKKVVYWQAYTMFGEPIGKFDDRHLAMIGVMAYWHQKQKEEKEENEKESPR